MNLAVIDEKGSCLVKRELKRAAYGKVPKLYSIRLRGKSAPHTALALNFRFSKEAHLKSEFSLSLTCRTPPFTGVVREEAWAPATRLRFKCFSEHFADLVPYS